MRVFPVGLAVSLVALLGLWVPSWAEAANYFVESVPVYQLDILDDQDPDTFSYAVDCLLTTSTTELSVAVANSWTNKGIVCYVSPVQAPGTPQPAAPTDDTDDDKPEDIPNGNEKPTE